MAKPATESDLTSTELSAPIAEEFERAGIRHAIGGAIAYGREADLRRRRTRVRRSGEP